MSGGWGDRVFSRVYGAAGAVDPLSFAEKELGIEFWSKEREIVESVRDHRLTCVPSGNGLGKSFTAAAIAAWWVASDPVADRFVLMTAPSASLITAVLWQELRQHHRRGALPGELLGSEWRIGGRLVALAKKTSDFLDEGRAESGFAGLHRRGGVLAILDESSGVENWLWTAVRGLTTSPSSRILALGNPLRSDGEFARIAAPGSGWNVIRVSVLESPNFTSERISSSLAESLPNQVWVDEIEATYGRGSPTWMARVEGRFPPNSDDGLVSAEWLETAHEVEFLDWGAPVTFGVDVARQGNDQTCIVRANGHGHVRVVHAAKHADLMATCGAVIQAVREEPGGALVVVDEIGVGGGVIDRLREEGLEGVVAFNAAARANDTARFANRRAEVFWVLRERLSAGELDLDSADEELSRQLLSLRWDVNSSGKVQLESKDSMRRRGVPSPDRADAVAMALGAGVRAVMPVAAGPGGSLTADLLTLPRDAW
jgi:hypothetical protein